MFKTRYFLAALLAIVVCACHPVENNDGKQNEGENNTEQNDSTQTPEPIITPEEPEPDPFWTVVEINTEGLVKTSFTEDNTVIANPERGMYYPYSWDGENKPSRSVSDFKSKRAEGYTLFLFEFWLTSFMDKDISQTYLDGIQDVIDNAREAGVKPIIRFGYKHRSENEAKPWDAEVDVVLRHVEQIKPILQANADVIHSLQAGFVGVWGEWYYTDHFVMAPSSDSDYEPRRRLINALLDALPADRQIAVRTPAFKTKLLRITYKDTLTFATAYQDTPQARIAGHNDCFVANQSDYGTFNGSSERKFWESDTKYTIMGGETCDASNTYSDYDNAKKALAAQHWTYLNSDYNKKVYNKWGSNFNEVKKKLGYRLVLHESYISPDITAGSNVRTVFKLSNDGYAAPINPRGLELILVNKSSGEKTVIPVEDENPRFWLAGKKPQFEVDFTAQAAGSYTLYLNLPDPTERLHDNPLFSIRLANQGTWEVETGYNKITEFEVR